VQIDFSYSSTVLGSTVSVLQYSTVAVLVRYRSVQHSLNFSESHRICELTLSQLDSFRRLDYRSANRSTNILKLCEKAIDTHRLATMANVDIDIDIFGFIANEYNMVSIA
jgi:hypothetical protein